MKGMKGFTRVVLLVCILCAAAAPLGAQNLRVFVGGGAPGAIDVAIWAAIIVDFTGYGLFSVPAFVEDPFTSLYLSEIGCATLAVGGLAWNTFLDVKQRGWEREGITVTSSARQKSWGLVWASVGCEAAAVVSGIVIGDNLAGFLTSLLLGLAGGVVEVINLTGPRLEWMVDMSAAYDGQHTARAGTASAAEAGATVALPVVQASWPSGRARPDIYFGLSVQL